MKTASLVKAALLSACVIGSVQQAFASPPPPTPSAPHGWNPSLSLTNPRNPANVAPEAVVDRVLSLSSKPAHAGENDNFSSPSLFAEYGFSSNEDTRTNGFDNDINSYTVGGDVMFGEKTLVGLMLNYMDSSGDNDLNQDDEITAWTGTFYVSQPLSEGLFAGASLSYSAAQSDTDPGNDSTDTVSYVLAPYLMAVKQMDKWTFSLTPSYVLAYQDVDYSGAASDDTALVGKLSVMGRAAYAITDRLSASVSANFNQVIHSHMLDGDDDTDHHWMNAGAKLNYQVTDQLAAYVGYSRDFLSNFEDNNVNVGLSYAF